MTSDQIIAIYNLNSTDNAAQSGYRNNEQDQVSAILTLAIAVGDVAEALWKISKTAEAAEKRAF